MQSDQSRFLVLSDAEDDVAKICRISSDLKKEIDDVLTQIYKSGKDRLKDEEAAKFSSAIIAWKKKYVEEEDINLILKQTLNSVERELATDQKPVFAKIMEATRDLILPQTAAPRRPASPPLEAGSCLVRAASLPTRNLSNSPANELPFTRTESIPAKTLTLTKKTASSPPEAGLTLPRTMSLPPSSVSKSSPPTSPKRRWSLLTQTSGSSVQPQDPVREGNKNSNRPLARSRESFRNDRNKSQDRMLAQSQGSPRDNSNRESREFSPRIFNSRSHSNPTSPREILQPARNRYSSDEVFDEPRLHFNYLDSGKELLVLNLMKQVKEEVLNKNITDESVYVVVEIDGKQHELIVTQKDNKLKIYLLDYQNTKAKSQNGTVLIGYPIPEFVTKEQKSKLNSIDEMKKNPLLAKKIPNCKLATIKRLEETLQITGRYVDSCVKSKTRIDKEVVFLSTWFDGPTLTDVMYKLDKTKKKEDVESVIGRRYITPDKKIAYLMDIIFKLREFHVGYGLIHRDIKPDNIVLVKTFKKETGVESIDSKFIDLDESSRQDTTEKVKYFGTNGYYPPEEDYILASDIYVTGYVCLELLSMRNHQLSIINKTVNRSEGAFIEDTMLNTTEMENSLDDMFSGGKDLKNQFKKEGIYDTWMQLPIEQLFSYLSPSLVNVLPGDLEKLKANPVDIINEICFQLYILPKIVKLIKPMVSLKPEDRPTAKDLTTTVSELMVLEKEFENRSKGMNKIHKASRYLPAFQMKFDSKKSKVTEDKNTTCTTTLPKP